MNARHDKQTGFTIVELLIVVVVIAILAAITIVAFNGISQQAKTSAVISDTQQAAKKVSAWSLQNNESLPNNKTEMLTATGLSDGSGRDYQYTRLGNSFCLTVTNQGLTRHIVGSTSGNLTAMVEGPCPGHPGVIPTTLANGSTCPTGFIVVPGNALFGTNTFCVMKYEAKNVSSVATSEAAGTPWINVTQAQAVTSAATACAGCHLITDNEWLTIAHNIINVDSNWSGGTVGSGSVFIGHTDSNPNNLIAAAADNDPYNSTGQTTGDQRRTHTLSNGEVIWDLSGNAREWTTSDTPAGTNLQPGLAADTTWSWRDWNTANMRPGQFATSFPAYGTPAASGWGLTQRIGRPYTNNGTFSTTRGTQRGGSFNYSSNAGVFTLDLSSFSSAGHTAVGFRSAK